MTINKGDVRSGAAAKLIGIVTPYYFAFHSTARNVLLEAPNISEFFPETLFDNSRWCVDRHTGSTGNRQHFSRRLKHHHPAAPQLSPTEQAMIASFQGTPIPAAQPLTGHGSNLPGATPRRDWWRDHVFSSLSN